MKRRIIALAFLLLLTVQLAGCGLRSGDDLYALPKTSVEYDSLRQALQSLLDSGLEYAAPLAGTNTQPVQDVDLNGDGIGEAVAFFRDPSSAEEPLKAYVFAQNEDGEYETMTVVSGQGTAVSSVSYPQLDGDENREILISWQVSSGIYALSAYSVWQGGSMELLAPQNYTRYTVQDMDGDGVDEVILFQLSLSDVNNNRAEYYAYGDGGLTKQSEAYLSTDLSSIDRIRNSRLYSGENAVYVTGSALDDGTGETALSGIQITDILALKEGSLVNVSREDSAGSSLSTRRQTYVSDQDLNGDGIWELPILSHAYELLEDGTVCLSETFYLISWVQYDIEGNQHQVCTTYYNSADGWYLILPQEWKNQVALARNDYSSGATVERCIQFYSLSKRLIGQPSQLQTDPETGVNLLTNTNSQLFLEIVKNTGTDRVARSKLGSRVALETPDETASYAVELTEPVLDGWTAETVQENLNIIVTKWSSE